jgi:hypothetical protein
MLIFADSSDDGTFPFWGCFNLSKFNVLIEVIDEAILYQQFLLRILNIYDNYATHKIYSRF